MQYNVLIVSGDYKWCKKVTLFRVNQPDSHDYLLEILLHHLHFKSIYVQTLIFIIQFSLFGGLTQI